MRSTYDGSSVKHAVQDLHVERVTVKQRRRPVAELNAEPPVVGLQIRVHSFRRRRT